MGPAYIPPQKRRTYMPITLEPKTVQPPSHLDFDRESGQIYREHEVVFKKNKKQSSDWIGELKTPAIVRKIKPSKLGARSLVEMAKTKCVSEFRNFTPQHFEIVPWSLASTMWEEIVLHHSESFHSWRTLAAAYSRPDEFGRPEYRYHIEIKQPHLPLQEYLRGISSVEDDWLTVLRVSPKQLTIAELMAITGITNLTVLDLSDGQITLDQTVSPLNERILRAWSELASSGSALTHMRVLMLGWQEAISEWIFKYLDHFPSLRYVITTDCKNMHQKNRASWEESAQSHGWAALHAKKSAKELRPLLDDKSFYVSAVSSLYYHAQEQVPIDVRSKTANQEPKPILECWLGTPRPWTHILDDFPGTRTIWFEKTEYSLDVCPGGNQVKRSRNTTSTSLLPQSPPRKRMQGGRVARLKATSRSVADMLADMES